MNRRYFIRHAARIVSLAPVGISLAVPALLGGVAAGCARAPYTGRKQLMLVSRDQELSLGAQAAQQVLKKEKPCTNAAYRSATKDVGGRIARAADRPSYDWAFYCVQDKAVNAYCLPGGKIFVNSGLFSVAKNRNELAVVVGHEAAHAIARHAAERMSVSLLTQLGRQAATIAVGSAAPEAVRAFQVASGIGASVGIILPFSREQEYEADRVGLILTAKAGYDPRAAVEFWTRMSQHHSGEGEKKQRPPEYASTHPSDANRIAEIKAFLPQALQYYRKA